MNRLVIVVVAGAWLSLVSMATAQRPADAPPLVEAKKEVVVNWTLGGQAWDFKQVLSVYEPVKGVFDPTTNEAIWTLQLAKDLQPGEVGLHQTKLTPFRPVFLTAEKTVIATDAKVEITAISGKMGDTIQMIVTLPEPEMLATVKFIRIERRTAVGF